MIGIGAGTGHYADRFHERERFIVGKDADQLRDQERRMRLIDLDNGIIEQFAKVALARLHIPQDELRGAACQKILLVKSEFFPLTVGIVRIEEQRQVLLDSILVEQYPVVNDRSVRAVDIEQAELVDPALVTRDPDLIHPGCERPPRESHVESHFRGIYPGVPLHPAVRVHLLDAVFKRLPEKAEVIVQSDPHGGISESSDRVHITCGQKTQSAASERRLRFRLEHIRQVLSVTRKDLLRLPEDPEVDQRILKEPPGQELRGHIVYLLLAAVLLPYFEDPLDQEHQHQIGLIVAACFQRFAEPLVSQFDELALHIEDHHIEDHILVSHWHLLRFSS